MGTLRNHIKHILREDDFDWVDDLGVDPLLAYPNNIIRFLVPEEKWVETQELLHGLGYSWANGKPIIEYSRTYPLFAIYKHSKTIYRSSDGEPDSGGKLIDNPFFDY